MKSFPQRCTPWSLHGSSTLKDIDQYHHDRDNQENVNESSHRERSDQTQRPEDKQNYRYGPEHFSSPPAVIHSIDRYRSHRSPVFLFLQPFGARPPGLLTR